MKKRIRKTIIYRMYTKAYKYYLQRILFPSIYRRNAQKPIDENKVVFIEVREPELSNSLQVLYKDLQKKNTYKLCIHTLRSGFAKRKEYQNNCRAMLADIADAKYIFISDTSSVVSCVPMRKETIYTQLWHGCGAFKKFGMSTSDLLFGNGAKELMKYPNHKNYTYVTVSSDEVIWAYEEAMNLKSEEQVVRATGISRTDVFFDKEYIAAARDKLLQVMPEAKDKKVILYAPTFRGLVSMAKTPECFDYEMFAKKLSQDYVLLTKHHPFVKKLPEIPESCSLFAKDCTDAMTIEELICVSDICISDYSSLVFEYSLFEKPMLFYAYDLDEYFDWRGFYYDYHEFTPGPVCTTNEEMIDYILNIEERFDKDKVVEFRKKFMSACDGHATERIEKLVFGE